LTPDLARAAIAETKAQWWQTQIPSYLQWSTDVGAIETTYTTSVVGNRLQRVSLLQAAGVKYALDVGNAIKEYEDSSAATDEEFATAVINNHGAAALKRMLATRDQALDLAAAELQKQLTGNEGQYNNSVSSINSAYQQKLSTAQSDLDSALKTATEQKNSKNALATKTKESKIAAAEEEYAQTEATLDAQYGSESAGGDTGSEGATRRAAIATRDAQYYAARDTSWANTLSGSTTLGNSPWSVKAISDASAQAAFSTSRASAQAAHDAAMLDAVEDWQLSSRDSLTDLLFAEGQSRESFSVATANVYADWENGVGNLLGDKPEGTEWKSPIGQLNKELGSPISDYIHQPPEDLGYARLFLGDETEPGTGSNEGTNGPALPTTPNESSSTDLDNAIKEYEEVLEEGVRGLSHRAILPKEMEQLLQGLDGIDVYRTDRFIVVKANGLSFVFERKFQPSRSDPRPYWILREILPTEGFSSTAIVEHAKNDSNIAGLQGQESILTFALHVLPGGTLADKLGNQTGENSYYVALMTAGDLTLVGGLYFKATTRIGKAVLLTDVAVNGVGAGGAAYQFANSDEGKSAHAGEFVLRLAAMGLGINSLRLSQAKDKLVTAVPETSALTKVVDEAPGSVADDLAGAGTRKSRPGSILANPANRLVETGVPLKNGIGWRRRWIRMTEADELAQRQAISNRYNELLDEATHAGLSGQARRDFLFEQMRQFRTNWLENFLENRNY
jgi:hypothetical protein